jgi:hypothetical protein
MIRAAAIALAICLLAGCTTFDPHPELPDVPTDITYWDNACLPAAISMSRGLEKYGIQSQVVVLEFTDRKGHALCFYRYRGRIWAYDTGLGSVEVRGNWFFWGDLAKTWAARWQPQRQIKTTHWL